MAMGILSLLFWSVLIIELVELRIVVAVSDIEPRSAAFVLLVPAAAIWLYGSFRRPWRRIAATLFPPYLG